MLLHKARRFLRFVQTFLNFVHAVGERIVRQQHLGVAFEPDPEAEIRKLNTRRGELERALASHENDNQQSRVQFEQAKEGVAALNRLLPRLNLLADGSASACSRRSRSFSLRSLFPLSISAESE